MNTLLQGPRYGMRMLRLSEQLVLGPTDRPVSKWRRRRNKLRRRRGVIFWSLISVVLLYGFVIEPMRLVVRKTTITLPAWPVEFRDLRVTVFSDLHVGPPHITLARLRDIVEEANATEADLILMPGDFVETPLRWRMAEPEAIAAELKRLRAKAGVFATLGNHDWWYNPTRVRQALEKEGIRVLDDQAVKIEHRGKTFWLVGFADKWAGRPNIEQTSKPEKPNALDSPRLTALAREVKSGNHAAVQQFWEDVKSKIPLVESIPENDHLRLVTFLRRGGDEARDLKFIGPPELEKKPLSRLAETDVWFLTARLPVAARFTYGFTDPMGKKRGFADPLNPLKFGNWSLVELPGAPPQPWIQVQLTEASAPPIAHYVIRKCLAMSCHSPPRSGITRDGIVTMTELPHLHLGG